MKEIARMALKPGMIISADIYNYQGKLIIPEGTQVNSNIISKLTRHSVMSVPVKDEDVTEDNATYSEKIRSSKGFASFQAAYHSVLPVYRKMMKDFVFNGILFKTEKLMGLYDQIFESFSSHESLLDYLYNMSFQENDITYTHSLNSALIAGLFASWLSISEEKSRLLIQCALLHDIGKLKLPDSLIMKTGKLTDLEFEKIKTHTLLGFGLLQNVDVDDHVLKTVLMHHERYDGTGYPSRLHDKQIDIYARYMAIIDAYEAMTSAKSYRQAKNPFEVIEIFEKDAFKYDPELLRTILYRLANHMVGFNVLLSNDEVAEVIMISQKEISRPLTRTKNGTFIDLSSHKNLSVKGFY